jgi:histidine triad (HIT) family protein
MDCIFCKIRNNIVPATLVYEDDRVIAFNDIHPRASFHVLIVTKDHIPTLNDLEDEALAGHLLLVAAKLAKKSGFADDGYRVIMNCNQGGGQEVYHIHLHLMANLNHDS